MKQIIKCPACLGEEEWRWNTPHFRALWGLFTAELILTSLQVVGILETGVPVCNAGQLVFIILRLSAQGQ